MVIGQDLRQEVELQRLSYRSFCLYPPTAWTAINNGIFGQSFLWCDFTHCADYTAMRHCSVAANFALGFQDVIVTNLHCFALAADLEDITTSDLHSDLFRLLLPFGAMGVHDRRLFFDQIVVTDNYRSGFSNNPSFWVNDRPGSYDDFSLDLGLLAHDSPRSEL